VAKLEQCYHQGNQDGRMENVSQGSRRVGDHARRLRLVVSSNEGQGKVLGGPVRIGVWALLQRVSSWLKTVLSKQSSRNFVTEQCEG